MNRSFVIAAVLIVLAAACGGSSSHVRRTAPSTQPRPTTGTSLARTTLPPVTTASSTPPNTALPCGTAPAPAPAATTRRLVLRRRPDAAHPFEVLVVGDSIAETTLPSQALGFQTWARPRGFPSKLDSIAFPGFGLLSSLPGILQGKKANGFPQFADWQKILDDAITKYDPDLVVVLIGAWDMPARLINGQYLRPTDCAWGPHYRALLELAWAHLTAKGARVAWLAFPCSAQLENPEHHLLNATFHALAAAHPTSVAYLDLDRFVCPADQVEHSMRAPDGRTVTVRGGDNIHFDFYGAPPVLGPWFGAEATRLLGLP